MAEISNDLCEKYPNFIEIDTGNFLGYYEVNDIFFVIEICSPNYPNVKNSRIDITHGLDIDDYKIPEDCNELPLVSIIPKLYKYLQEIGENSKTDNPILSVEQIATVYDTLYKIKIEIDCRIDHNAEFSIIRFINFAGYENHFVELESAQEESSDKHIYFNVHKHSLPETGAIEYFKNSATIESHLMDFRQYLEHLEEYYENVDKIDSLCFVVDPPKITTKTTWRIIKFNEKVFLKMLLDPFNSSNVPELQFIGPVEDIQPLMTIFNDKVSDWDNETSVHDNLLKVFGIMYFMVPYDTEIAEETGKNCGICYAFRSDEGRQVPLIVCDNLACGQIFHIACLKDWFQSSVKQKIILDITVGICPYCKHKLSTNFVQFYS